MFISYLRNCIVLKHVDILYFVLKQMAYLPILNFLFSFPNWYGRLPRVSDRSFIQEPNSHPDLSINWELWDSCPGEGRVWSHRMVRVCRNPCGWTHCRRRNREIQSLERCEVAVQMAQRIQHPRTVW